MKARATIVTIGASLALAAPVAHATVAGNAVQCSRALQFVVLGGGAATDVPVRAISGRRRIAAAVAPHHYQVLWNSF